jgi:Holliday junction DNA helicase RuvA
MIASISGRIQDILPDSLVVEVGGVGFQVYVPKSTRDEARRGEAITLHTWLVVRQDMMALYGFASREEKEYFSLLLTVDGIGPRSALSVLSTLSPDAIRRAVFHEQPEVFSRVPGVGKKTAQKILLQLQDRIRPEIGLEPVRAVSDADAEVIGALTSLGFHDAVAQAALQSLPKDAPEDVESRLRLALQYFMS